MKSSRWPTEATVKVIRNYVRSICVEVSVVAEGFSEDMQYDQTLDPDATVSVVPSEPTRVMLAEAEQSMFRKRPDQVKLWRPEAVLVMEKESSFGSARGNRAQLTTTYRLWQIIGHGSEVPDNSKGELVG